MFRILFTLLIFVVVQFSSWINQDNTYSIGQLSHGLFDDIIGGISNEYPTATNPDAAWEIAEPEFEFYENLGITKEEIIDFLEGRLSRNGYPLISEAAYIESTFTLDGIGTFLGSKYTLVNGIDFYFLTDSDTEDLKQFAFYTDTEKLSVEEYQLLGYLNGSIPFLFEPDTYTELDQELGLSSNETHQETFAFGEDREYYFYKNDGQSCFYAIPFAGELITLDQIDLFNNDTDPGNGLSDPEKDKTAQETPAPSTQAPAQVVSQPTFTGGTCTDIDVYTGMPASIVSKFLTTDIIMIAGRLSGISGQQNMIISWVYPNGATESRRVYYMTNNETTNIGYYGYETGAGSGSVSVSLESTGEVLATYYFTVVE